MAKKLISGMDALFYKRAEKDLFKKKQGKANFEDIFLVELKKFLRTTFHYLQTDASLCSREIREGGELVSFLQSEGGGILPFRLTKGKGFLACSFRDSLILLEKVLGHRSDQKGEQNGENIFLEMRDLTGTELKIMRSFLENIAKTFCLALAETRPLDLQQLKVETMENIHLSKIKIPLQKKIICLKYSLKLDQSTIYFKVCFDTSLFV